MRRLLVVLVVLALLLLAADFAARAWARDRLSRELQASLAVSERPSVALGGFPFLPRLVAGSLPSASVTARDVPVESLSIRRVDLLFHDIAFSPAELLSGRLRSVRIGRGKGTARLRAADVTEALRERGLPVQVRFASGKAFLSSDSLGIGEIEAEVSLDGNTLALTPVEGTLPVPLSYELPALIPGLRYAHLAIRRSRAVLFFRLKNAKLGIDGAAPR